MNVYDFDGTVYDGDSSIDFWRFCVRGHPSVFIKCFPRLAKGAVLYALGRIPKESWKERFFSFLEYIPADANQVSFFWEKRSGRIKPWYLKQKQASDVIISASPAFLLGPLCERLGISLIASEVDPATGRFTGLNCSGDEKVRRFRREFPDGTVDRFYTDSKKDLPMAVIAEQAYFVHKNTIRELRTGKQRSGPISGEQGDHAEQAAENAPE